MISIEVVDFSALGEVVIDSWITRADFGGFVFDDTGGIVCAGPWRWLRSEIISNGDLYEPAVGCSGGVAIVRDENKDIDSGSPRQHPISYAHEIGDGLGVAYFHDEGRIWVTVGLSREEGDQGIWQRCLWTMVGPPCYIRLLMSTCSRDSYVQNIKFILER